MKKTYLLTLTAAALCAASAHAAIVAKDGFDYTGNNTLDGDGSASDSGWNSSWRGNWYTAAGGSLATTGTQAITPTSGNRVVKSSARSIRDFDTDYDDSTTQTYYMSFLFQDAGASGYSTIELLNGGDSDSTNRTFQLGGLAGDSGGNTSSITARANNNGSTLQVMGARTTAIELYVIQIDFVNGGNDIISIWRNPGATLGIADGTISVASFAFDRLSLASFDGTDLWIDEFRFGTELSDVTTAAVPEPSAFALLGGFVALGICLVRRRVRS